MILWSVNRRVCDRRVYIYIDGDEEGVYIDGDKEGETARARLEPDIRSLFFVTNQVRAPAQLKPCT